MAVKKSWGVFYDGGIVARSGEGAVVHGGSGDNRVLGRLPEK